MDSAEDHEDDDADEQTAEDLEYLSGAAHIVQIDGDFDLDSGEFTTSFVATIDDADNVTAYAARALNGIVVHALNGGVDNDTRYDDAFYYGVMVDTGCDGASSGGLSQYRAYCRHFGEPEKINRTKTAFCKFGIN